MSHLISVAMITMNEEKAVARVIEDICDALRGRDESGEGPLSSPYRATGRGRPQRF